MAAAGNKKTKRTAAAAEAAESEANFDTGRMTQEQQE